MHNFKVGDIVVRKAEYLTYAGWYYGRKPQTISDIVGSTVWFEGDSSARTLSYFELLIPSFDAKASAARARELLAEFNAICAQFKTQGWAITNKFGPASDLKFTKCSEV